MNLGLRLFLILLLCIQLLLIVSTVHKKNISMKYASFWILTVFILIVLAVFPNVVISISSWLGFEAPANMVFLLCFCIIFYILFLLTLSFSKLNIKLKETIQEISILKKELEEYFPGYEIHTDRLSLSVACHIGPGAMAVACSKKIEI